MNLFDTDIENCLSVLHRGGIILYPTDTIWGIGCDATNPIAVEKIVKLKDRPDSKSFVVLVASQLEVLQYVSEVNHDIFSYLNRSPRSTTVIYDGSRGLADNVTAADGSVAIRICREEFCNQLIRQFGKPVVSTSANSSGNPSPALFSSVEDKIKRGVDYIVKYRQEEDTPATPSSIIRWRKGKVEVIRK